ncbi:MAG TPA: MarR family transcriptional regulator, partial [Desulfomonilia bacterium]|nr:MarR family transcriptional regulator [Desulfomonilia bacterium]
ALFSLTQYYSIRAAKYEKNSPTGYTFSDRAVLMVVGQLAPLTSRELSGFMNINPGTISQYVHNLVMKGLVEKRQDEKDRRKWWLGLTKKGRLIYRGTITEAIVFTRDFISALNEKEQRKLHELLLKASHNLGFKWQ